MQIQSSSPLPLDLQEKSYKRIKQFEQFYESQTPAVKNDDEAYVWCSGIANPFFNRVMHIRCSKSTEETIGEIFRDFAKENISFWVHNGNSAPNLTEVLQNLEFKSLCNQPLMTLKIRKLKIEDPHSGTPGIIKEAARDSFMNIISLTYKLSDDIRDRFFSLLFQNSNAEHYEIYENDRPIGAGTLSINNKIGGLFNFAVLPDYQRKGYGTILTHFLIKRAHDIGLKKLLLFSSPAGQRLYESIGFEPVLHIQIYAREKGLEA